VGQGIVEEGLISFGSCIGHWIFQGFTYFGEDFIIAFRWEESMQATVCGQYFLENGLAEFDSTVF